MSHHPSTGEGEVLSIVHHHPGRLRLRSDALVEADALAARIHDALVASGEVLRVEHHPGTGSLLVEYEPGQVAPDAILERAARAAGLCPGRELPRCPERTHGERFLRVCRELNASAYEMTGFRVEPRTLVPIGMAALSAAFFFVNRGQRLPRWDNLAYWSVSLFAMLHGREIGAAVTAVTGAEPGAPPPGGEQAPR